jgi:VIT1/CCC1 family predicted Fe2+/Mn2+ transporter
MVNSESVLSEEDIEEIAKKCLKTELMVTSLYHNLSNKFKGSEEGELFSEFAIEEGGHAKFWREFLKRRNIDPSVVKVNHLQVAILSFIFGILGMALTLKIFESIERRVIQYYAIMFKTDLLSPEEKENVTLFLLSEFAHEEEIEKYEAKFDIFINKISTIFTQTSGGLVIVLSTSIGLAGVYDNPILVGVTGLIVGITSAMNTIVGFYFFGRTKRKLNEDILDRINRTCGSIPEAYLERVKKYMRQKNYSEEVVELIVKDAHEKGMIEKIIAEEEYGIKGDLPDPMQNALWAGLFKTVGTVLPLSPFFIGISISRAIPLSVLITFILIILAGSLAAIAAEVSIKDKIVELVSGVIVLASLTYILGKSASFILSYLNIG